MDVTPEHIVRVLGVAWPVRATWSPRALPPVCVQPDMLALIDECIVLHPSMGACANDFPLVALNLAVKAELLRRTGDMARVRFLRTLVDSTVGSGIVAVAAAPSMSAWLQAVDAAAAAIESAGSLSQHASDFPPLDFAMGRIIPMAIDAVRATLGGGAPQVSAAHHPKASALLGAGGRIRGIIISEHHFSPTLRLSLPVPGSHQIPLEHFEQASQRPAGSRPPQAPGGSQSAPRSVLWPRCAASGLCGWILDVSP